MGSPQPQAVEIESSGLLSPESDSPSYGPTSGLDLERGPPAARYI
jgi:hypothetical protein